MERAPGAAALLIDGDTPSVDADSDNDLAARSLDRLSLCFATAEPGVVLQGGDQQFVRELVKFYPAAESRAAEKLVRLKSRLAEATREEFWATATKGIADVVDAQYAFISKRILINDQDVPVEMPPIGEKGSCLMGMAFYYNDQGAQGTVPDIKYEAYAAPCAYMKHDKVFIIPGQSNSFVPHDQNPNAKNMLSPIATYIAVPLFSEGKCFAHFGVSWSDEGECRRQLSWGFLEMVLHALEDMVLQRVLQGGGLGQKLSSESSRRWSVVPHGAITASQSLKPYARSLSHELRTPMQGVVGMLDVMHATVQEAMEGLCSDRLRLVFEALRENIETVQDSSRRAVEAADNVVHAYDMNMGVPETQSSIDKGDRLVRQGRSKDRKPDIIVTGNHMPIGFNVGQKRRRDNNALARPAAKRLKSDEEMDEAFNPANNLHEAARKLSQQPREDEPRHEDLASRNEEMLESPPYVAEHGIVPGLHHSNPRDLLQYVVNDALRVGGRPDSAIAEQTEFGESIEVRVQSPNGEEKVKIIEWAVDPAVPETILIDEKDLAKVMSCVFLNALKFTEEGRITLTAKLTPKSRYIVVSCTDTGPGIPTDFLPNLFKPFSREDDSLTRQSEGLGLGLLVAKGLARKLGGDIKCVRADIQGPNHGCEFQMRVPITPGDALSRPASPFSSPAPSRRSRYHSVDSDSVLPDAPPGRITNSPRRILESAPPSALASTRSPPPTLRPLPQTYPPPKPSTHDPPSETPSLNSGSVRIRRTSTFSPLTGLQSSAGNGHGPEPSLRRQSIRSRPATSVNGSALFDRDLAKKYPLTFLVAEDNKINRRLLVSMLGKLGYKGVYEAYDGASAVRLMEGLVSGQALAGMEKEGGKENAKVEIGKGGGGNGKMVDVVLMDLWMPLMDGYEATERILGMAGGPVKAVDASAPSGASSDFKRPTIMAVTADVTDGALERATKVGMKGFLTKPYQLKDLERLIVEFVESERGDRMDEFFWMSDACIAMVRQQRGVAFMGSLGFHRDQGIKAEDDMVAQAMKDGLAGF